MGDLLSHEQQISNLLFRYARLMDAGDFDGVAALFDRGTYGGMPGAKVPELLRSMIFLHDGKMGTRHVTTNVEIEFTDATGHAALVRSYFTVFQQLPTLPLQPIVAGSYTDTMHRDENGWYFVERLMDMTAIGDLSQHISYRP